MTAAIAIWIVIATTLTITCVRRLDRAQQLKARRRLLLAAGASVLISSAANGLTRPPKSAALDPEGFDLAECIQVLTGPARLAWTIGTSHPITMYLLLALATAATVLQPHLTGTARDTVTEPHRLGQILTPQAWSKPDCDDNSHWRAA